QASGNELPTREADYAARAGSARFRAGRRGTLHRDGRSLRAKLLPAGGDLLRISGARISGAQILPGSFTAHRQAAARSACAARAGAKDLQRILEAFPALPKEARSGRSAGGIGAAAKQQRSEERGVGKGGR